MEKVKKQKINGSTEWLDMKNRRDNYVHLMAYIEKYIILPNQVLMLQVEKPEENIYDIDTVDLTYIWNGNIFIHPMNHDKVHTVLCPFNLMSFKIDVNNKQQSIKNMEKRIRGIGELIKKELIKYKTFRFKEDTYFPYNFLHGGESIFSFNIKESLDSIHLAYGIILRNSCYSNYRMNTPISILKPGRKKP